MAMKIGVVGLGKLGSPLALLAASVGHDVIAVDINRRSVELLNQYRPPVEEPGLEQLLSLPFSIRASTEFSALADREIVMVVVPTPSGPDGRFSNVYVEAATRRIGEVARAPRRPRLTVVIVSTVMPGSMRGAVREALGPVVGWDVGLVYSPQLIALGSVVDNLRRPDLVIIGQSDSVSGDHAEAFFCSLHDRPGRPVKRMTLEEAEVTKIGINAYLTMKMSFANVLGMIAEEHGLDAAVIADAIGADSRIGRKYLTPGTAYGGPCFPRDSVAFASYLEELGLPTQLADASGAVNAAAITRVTRWARRIYQQDQRPVGILGLAYKTGTHVTEASAGVAVAELLVNSGVPVMVHDPAAKVFPAGTLVEDAQRVVDLCGAIFIATPWPQYAALQCGGKFVCDPWRVLR